MEDYPSPAEGNGLENRQAGKTVQGFESLILRTEKQLSYSLQIKRQRRTLKVEKYLRRGVYYVKL